MALEERIGSEGGLGGWFEGWVEIDESGLFSWFFFFFSFPDRGEWMDGRGWVVWMGCRIREDPYRQRGDSSSSEAMAPPEAPGE